MNRKSVLLFSTITVFASASPAWAQSSETGPGNPTLLQAIQNLQASVAALQGTVNNIVTNGVAAQPRRFYLTPGTADGANAGNACQAGFHMASLWEIFDPTHLAYDTGRGFKYQFSDAGKGPPEGPGARGWIRTGNADNDDIRSPGYDNCNHYTEATSFKGAIYGTQVFLYPIWSPAPSIPSTVFPWFAEIDACSTASHVWCVEDE